MSEVGHKVGIHDVSWAPKNILAHPTQIATQASETGADFWVHMPNWRDLIVSNQTFKQLSFKPKFIDDSWWVDRAVELISPLEKPVSKSGLVKNVLTSVAYPTPPFARMLTQRELSVFPSSNLVRRWPVVEGADLTYTLAKRNEILNIMSPTVAPHREVLDIHSTNLELTPQQILDWQKQKPGRRLMFSALAVDERLDKYSLATKGQHNLISALIPYTSVVTLKLEALKDQSGEVVMTRDQVLNSILSGNMDTEYARRLKVLSQIVGTQANEKQVEWIVKVKSTADNFLVPKFVDFTKRIVR